MILNKEMSEVDIKKLTKALIFQCPLENVNAKLRFLGKSGILVNEILLFIIVIKTQRSKTFYVNISENTNKC